MKRKGGLTANLHWIRDSQIELEQDLSKENLNGSLLIHLILAYLFYQGSYTLIALLAIRTIVENSSQH